jgi:hypothetical protein
MYMYVILIFFFIIYKNIIICDFSNITEIRTSKTIYASFDLSVPKAPILY